MPAGSERAFERLAGKSGSSGGRGKPKGIPDILGLGSHESLDVRDLRGTKVVGEGRAGGDVTRIRGRYGGGGGALGGLSSWAQAEQQALAGDRAPWEPVSEFWN